MSYLPLASSFAELFIFSIGFDMNFATRNEVISDSTVTNTVTAMFWYLSVDTVESRGVTRVSATTIFSEPSDMVFIFA